MKLSKTAAAIHFMGIIACTALLSSCDSLFKGTKDVNERRVIATNNIESVNVNFITGSITFSAIAENEIRIKLTGRTNADRILFRTETVGKELEIECDENLRTPNSDLNLSIEAPAAQFSKIRIENVAGRISVTGIEADIISLDTVSGAITANAVKGAVTAETTSGSITVNYADKAYGTHAETNAGSITVGIPDGSSFQFKMRTTAGSKNCEFTDNGGKVGNGPEYPAIDLKTNAGSILIKKL